MLYNLMTNKGDGYAIIRGLILGILVALIFAGCYKLNEVRKDAKQNLTSTTAVVNEIEKEI